MKYIKKFENESDLIKMMYGEQEDTSIQPKYNIGDYVYINQEKVEYASAVKLALPYAKVLSFETFKYYSPDYRVEAINNDMKIFKIFQVDEANIIRSMSEDEIVEYESLKKSYKYNL
jgi:hypothetical protein